MISYLVDEDGNRSHAVVPIHEWKNMQRKDYLSTLDFMTFPEKHVINILNFLETLENYSIDDWKKSYDSYFDYYNKLDMIDFMVLYLFRSGTLGTLFDEETEKNMGENDTSLFDDTDRMHMTRIQLLKKDGSMFDWGAYTSVRKKIGISSEQEFLTYFHETLKFTDTSIEYFKTKYKRLHRNSEKDRLFIYDLNVLYADSFVKPEKDFFIEPQSVAKYLAKHLYNGNISQVYRATKEANERVQSF